MKLLPGEELILTSNEDKLILTSQRLILQDNEWRRAIQSIVFLEDISVMGTKFKPNSTLFTLSLIFLFFGMINIVSMIVGIALLLAWYLMKEAFIYVGSTGTTELYIEARRLSNEQVLYFLEKIQEAKAARIRALSYPISS